MVKTFVAKGNSVEFPVTGTAATSGEARLEGNRFGIVAGDAAIGETGVLELVGIFDSIPILSTDVVTYGAPLYWDDANSRLTITSAAGLLLVGTADEAKASGVATIRARLDGAVRLTV